jgi:integrase
MARRGRGEGSITQRADGRWMVRVDLGRGPDGRRLRKASYAATQGDAVKLLKKLAGRAVDGQLVSTSTPTVAAFLAQWFSANTDTWRPSTRRGYKGAIDLYLIPAFGRRRLEQLTPQAIQRWLLQQKDAHGPRRRIALAHAVLRSALSEAKRLQLVSLNAAELVKVPKPQSRTIAPFTVGQAAAFLKAAKRHRLGALFSVALACGLRLGEATGLRWEDVDLNTGEMRIRQQLQRVGKRLVAQELKTEKSRRTLVLPAVCLTALRVHRKRQLKERLKAGGNWIDSGLIFTTYRSDKGNKIGAGLHPRNVLRTLRRIIKSADGHLPQVRFHDLRHSAASILIAEGVALVEVSMLLGHSELRVTADFYSHLQKQTAAKAAQRMDAMLRATR